jgi:hypothetical protein
MAGWVVAGPRMGQGGSMNLIGVDLAYAGLGGFLLSKTLQLFRFKFEFHSNLNSNQ